MKDRDYFVLLAVVCGSLLVQSCATSTQSPAGPATRPVVAAASTPENAPSLDPEVTEAAKGYAQVTKDGVRMFCRRQRQTGSNMATNVCITEAQLREQIENSKKFRDDRMQQGRRCGSGPGCQNDR